MSAKLSNPEDQNHPEDQTSPAGRGFDWLCYSVIGLLTLLVWGQSARFDFVWDDHLLVLDNPSIRSVKNIPRMFVSLAMQSGELAPSFRPVRTAWYALLYALGGGAARPWIFHLSNVLWHAACAMLLFAVARSLFERVAGASSISARWTGLFVAIAFALHPANSEAVCWVKCLDDLMAGFFILAATWFLLRWNGNLALYIASLACFVVGIYSYESAVPFALAAFIIIYGYHRLPLRRSIAVSLPFFALALAFMVHRHWVMGRTSQSEPLSGSYGQTLIDMIPMALTYARLGCGVPPFSADYCDLVRSAGRSIFSGSVLAGVLALLAFGGWMIWTWCASLRLVASASLWFALFLLPVSNLIPTMQYIAERFLYLPLMGLLVAIGALALRVSQRGVTPLAGAAVICIWTVVSWNREQVWRDEVTLFVQSSLDQPLCKRLRENAVVSIFELPQVTPCFGLSQGTRKLTVAHGMSKERIPTALETLTRGHNLFPDDERFTAAIAVAYASLGQISNAIPFFELATRQNTNDASSWTDLGTAYTLQKNWSGAQKAYEAALVREPTNVVALERYSKLCSDLGEFTRALPPLQTLQRLRPGDQEIARRLREAEEKTRR